MPVLGEQKGGGRDKDEGLILCWSVSARCSSTACVAPSIQHKGKKDRNSKEEAGARSGGKKQDRNCAGPA